jgi:hypothetical protein
MLFVILRSSILLVQALLTSAPLATSLRTMLSLMPQSTHSTLTPLPLPYTRTSRVLTCARHRTHPHNVTADTPETQVSAHRQRHTQTTAYDT